MVSFHSFILFRPANEAFFYSLVVVVALDPARPRILLVHVPTLLAAHTYHVHALLARRPVPRLPRPISVEAMPTQPTPVLCTLPSRLIAPTAALIQMVSGHQPRVLPQTCININIHSHNDTLVMLQPPEPALVAPVDSQPSVPVPLSTVCARNHCPSALASVVFLCLQPSSFCAYSRHLSVLAADQIPVAVTHSRPGSHPAHNPASAAVTCLPWGQSSPPLHFTTLSTTCTCSALAGNQTLTIAQNLTMLARRHPCSFSAHSQLYPPVLIAARNSLAHTRPCTHLHHPRTHTVTSSSAGAPIYWCLGHLHTLARTHSHLVLVPTFTSYLRLHSPNSRPPHSQMHAHAPAVALTPLAANPARSCHPCSQLSCIHARSGSQLQSPHNRAHNRPPPKIVTPPPLQVLVLTTAHPRHWPAPAITSGPHMP